MLRQTLRQHLTHTPERRTDMKTLIALVKREVLEHKNIWRVPLILIGLSLLVKLSLLFGNLAFDVNVPEQFQLDDEIDSVVSGVIGKALSVMNYIIMLTMFVVAIFYALTCLYNERQDQSVLFWRSLPISDTLTVASKWLVALLLIPIAIIVCQAIVAILLLGGDSINFLANYYSGSLLSLSKSILWSLLPVIAWCVFCSEVASKNPFLLALIAPVVLILVDKLFLNGALSQLFLINRLTGVSDYTPMLLLSGLVFAGVCFAVTVTKRSQRI